MDKVDEALALSSFGAQLARLRALMRAAGDDWQAIADDPRVRAWHEHNRRAIFELMVMAMEEAMDETIAAQISTPATFPGNRRH